MEKSKFQVVEEKVLSQHWGTLREYTIDYDREDGKKDRQVLEVYDNNGDGACVLLHNRSKKTVVLTRQFRIPLGLREETDDMSIEVCAGKIEDDMPESAVKREILEETGYSVGEVEFLFESFGSPGSLLEKVYFYYAVIDDTMKVDAGGGVPDEQEEIEVLEVSEEKALALLHDRKILDMKTVILLQHLENRLLNGRCPGSARGDFCM